MSESLTVEQVKGCVLLNEIEALMAKMETLVFPLNHIFTPGLYVREIFMPAGSLITSKIHRTEHPFVISKGRVSVWTPDGGVMHYEAPFTGVTKPGTRRLLYIHEDTVWSTFHPTTKTDLAEIEKDIIEPHDIPIPVNTELMNQLKGPAGVGFHIPSEIPCTTS